jgi:hypothetical protein
MASLESIGFREFEPVTVYIGDGKGAMITTKEEGIIKHFIPHPKKPERGVIVVQIKGNGTSRVSWPFNEKARSRKIIQKRSN